jgi:hypothetical protein
VVVVVAQTITEILLRLAEQVEAAQASQELLTVQPDPQTVHQIPAEVLEDMNVLMVEQVLLEDPEL